MKPRKVDFTLYDEDYECAFLGALGFSSKLIERKTGLTLGQIGYRLRKANIKRLNFRNGQTATSQLILSNMRAPAQNLLESHLRKNRQWNNNK